MKELHILDLIDVKQTPYDKQQFTLTFTGNRIYVVNVIVIEGIVTWLLANEQQGGYYSLIFGDFILGAGRPYRHRHSCHKRRLRDVRYYFREWVACEADMHRSNLIDNSYALSIPGSNVRVKREAGAHWGGSLDWKLEWRIFMPINNLTTTPKTA